MMGLQDDELAPSTSSDIGSPPGGEKDRSPAPPPGGWTVTVRFVPTSRPMPAGVQLMRIELGGRRYLAYAVDLDEPVESQPDTVSDPIGGQQRSQDQANCEQPGAGAVDGHYRAS